MRNDNKRTNLQNNGPTPRIINYLDKQEPTIAAYETGVLAGASSIYG